ncbi:hypothetical protein N9514_03505 [Pseudomonadales bacterium]|nr:hypothetical protein [Pseudomonadales bacterium]MDA9297616.1 hypothetical protein [Pseudomonadales bacterium]MDA9316049.1 hypothetical protein [Pseudomonadales bacterium]MDB4069081.1 hypothetical protein [Pseudomonadales bacterium]MDB4149902.1 hypothetical protein [Pseudomonadales bacterium]|tara:strand:- start:1782 stop:2009 length:228 start_codon:yes stop_codon:yes gene_type:complete
MSDVLDVDDIGNVDMDADMDMHNADIDVADMTQGIDELDGTLEVRADMQRHDVRRKIEDMMERRRLREEFGDLDF